MAQTTEKRPARAAPGLVSMGDLTDQQIARLEEAMTQRRGIRTLEDWIETLDKMHADRRSRLTRQLEEGRRRLAAELDVLSRAVAPQGGAR